MSLGLRWMVLHGLVVVTMQLQMMFPPADRIRMGQLDDLKEECVEQSLVDNPATVGWYPDTAHEHELARDVFTKITKTEIGQQASLWFPSILNRQGEAERLVRTLNDHCSRLGGLQASVSHWPETPATGIHFSWNRDEIFPRYLPDSDETIVQGIQDTEDYVNNRLVKLGLCPYTKSMSRAAIGLEELGIQQGPVVIRHAGNMETAKCTTPAAVMAALYWKGVCDIIDRPEAEVATFLLLPPSVYDDDFAEFCCVCDELIEDSCVMVNGQVGRVWFHPQYNLEFVGESTPGHTVPLKVASQFMDDYLKSHPGIKRPSNDDLAIGHDRCRQTPHATLNLLRAAQLKRPKTRCAIYAKNILAMLQVQPYHHRKQLDREKATKQ